MTMRSLLLGTLLAASPALPAFCDDRPLTDAEEKTVETQTLTDTDTAPALSLNEELLGTFVTTPGARIEQSGSSNTATILQQGGSGNIAFSATDGSGNSVTIIQSGTNHLAGARIVATDDASVTIDQAGTGHRAAVIANGAHAADIGIVQRGAHESVTVEQTGAGQPIRIIQGF